MSSTSTTESPESVDRPRKKRRLLRWTAFFFICVLGLVFALHKMEVRRLNSAKSSIAIGDTRASVEQVLGKSSLEYFTGFPAQGGLPTVFGASYGTIVNVGRTKLDSAFFRVFGIPDYQTFGIPEAYNSYCSQSTANWPLRIEYDLNDIVTAIK